MQYKHAVINTNSKAGNAQPGGSGGARAPPIFWENFITLHLGPLNDYCVVHALDLVQFFLECFCVFLRGHP